MDYNDIRARLRTVVLAVDGLPANDIDSIYVLIDAGEESIALETLCAQIYEYDVEFNNAQRAELVDLGRSLDVSVAYLLGDPWAGSPGGCQSDG